MGHLWETGMALIFEPERIAYDCDEGLVRFFATEGLALVRCGVSITALAELEDDALGGSDAIVTTYLRHRELIQDIAERKYRARRFETGGNVVVRLQDVIAKVPLRRAPIRVATWCLGEGCRAQN